MQLFRIPFRRWPLWFHIAVACLILIAIAAGGWKFVRNATASLHARNAELQSQQTRLQTLQRAELKPIQGNFVNSFPPISRSDDVVRDMSRHAQSMNIQIASLAIATSEPSSSELRKVQYSLTATGDYRSVKAWLSEMLGRYPSLGVQTLSMRGLPSDAFRQEAQLVLVLFVKD